MIQESRIQVNVTIDSEFSINFYFTFISLHPNSHKKKKIKESVKEIILQQ